MDYLEEIREDYAESEDDSDIVIVERLLDAEGYVMRIPKELREDTPTIRQPEPHTEHHRA